MLDRIPISDPIDAEFQYDGQPLFLIDITFLLISER